MFASSVGSQGGSGRFVRLTVVVSVLLHATAGLGLLAFSFWKISKLNPRPTELTFVGDPTLQMMGSPAPTAPTPRTPPTVKPVKPRVRETTQPQAAVLPVEEQAVPGASNQFTAPGGAGDGTGSSNVVGPGTGDVPGGQGGDDPVATVVPPEKKEEPKAIAQDMIEGQRIAGTSQILLPANVLTSLRSDRVSEVRARIQLCVNERGSVSSLTFRRSSGRADVDEVITREMSRWRYAPYVVGGEAVSACFIVMLNYRITD
jgi:hypothetical protein